MKKNLLAVFVLWFATLLLTGCVTKTSDEVVTDEVVAEDVVVEMEVVDAVVAEEVIVDAVAEEVTE